MNLWKITPFIISIFCSAQLAAQTTTYQENVARYINTYKSLAIEEQQRSGIPAAITLAQGVHETNAGMSELATQANNHFGIKCKKDWTGATYTYTDDAPNECFRKYGNALDSYKDHTDYLKNSPRYNSLFQLSITDYAAWAAGLKRCGYATNPKYAQMLIKIIEQFHLQDYTYAAMDDSKNPLKAEKKQEPVLAQEQKQEIIPDEDTQPTITTREKKSGMVVNENATEEPIIKNNTKPPFGQLVRVNGLKAFYAKKGSTLLNEAIKFNIRYAKLLELNDLADAPLEADMFIYTEKKHSKGNQALHVVKPGETLLQAAQYEGVQVKYLKYYNKLADNDQPAAGALLYLQGMAEEKPELVKKETEKKIVNTSGHFAGDAPGAIPQGSTRMRAGYISKKEIEEAGKDKTIETTKPMVEKVTSDPGKYLATDAMASAEEKKSAEEAAAAAKAAEDAKNAASTPTDEKPIAITETPPAIAPIEKPAADKKEIEIAPQVTAKTETPQNTEQKAIETAPPPPVEPATIAETPAVQKEEAVVKADTAIAPMVQDTTTPIPTTTTEAPPPVPEIISTPEVAAAPPPAEPEKPKDEFDLLKAKLDRVVYASEASTKKATEAKQGAADTAQKEQKAQPKPTPGAAKANAGFVGIYTVQKGDTAFSIAKKNKITMKQLMEWNNLDFNEVKVGQQLRVK